MGKELSRMTNEELWQLFPIILREHDPSWPGKYSSEKQIIERIIGNENIVRISHIGSTSVPGLLAKPTIDILVEITDGCDTEKIIGGMTEGGYIFSPKPENPPPHMMFLKGYTPEGFKGQAYHVHVRFKGDWSELYFRDYLKDYKSVADEYAALKAELAETYEHDRDGYTDAKTDFINKYTALARELYKDRYKIE
ncbi:MAG: GrpB family protein [Burkholderiales bacterium]